jgi:hypothetical protein
MDTFTIAKIFALLLITFTGIYLLIKGELFFTTLKFDCYSFSFTFKVIRSTGNHSRTFLLAQIVILAEFPLHSIQDYSLIKDGIT